MNRIGSIFVLACVLGLSGLSARAQAQQGPQFSTYSWLTVDPGFNSGKANGWASGSDAVVTNLSSSTYFDIDPFSGTAHIYASMYLSGVWGDPGTVSPYYNFLENQGLQTYSTLALTTVFWNGTYYQFEDEVSVNLNGSAGLIRDPEHTWLIGNSHGNTYGIGAIPIDSSSSFQIFPAPHPSWLPDWLFASAAATHFWR